MDVKIDARDLRYAFGRFATGITVVTYSTSDGPRGFTANSFTSVSLEPPLLLISVDRRIRALDHLPHGPFAVNILRDDQRHLSDLFAGRKLDQDVHVPWTSASEPPHFKEALAIFLCRPWKTYDGGDHVLVLGEITSYQYHDGDALTYFYGRYGLLKKPEEQKQSIVNK
ncbi:MAG: flavin reductase family protein [Candidatus Carbobacillus altaicus]|uniref:Nitrilotriacetate monooxygenase component B n=1 Tax=Candidatus Carbonibacillus altaicus TaxID=2163959 RepID=A0A2R6Y0I5_9BACL|nr:flavin reductase family protein [Candidatus Carbobacillus altaicus]PTQ56191.1 MAG: Nitrilotriacetate monooxygenase component B [Candidatus Carbobacillus altaicus]